MLARAKRHWEVLAANASVPYRDDAEIVLAAAAQNLMALDYAGRNILYNQEFAKEAVKCHWGGALWFPRSVRSDPEVGSEVFSESECKDLRFRMRTLLLRGPTRSNTRNSIDFVYSTLDPVSDKAERELCSLAVKLSELNMIRVAGKLKDGEEFCLRCISYHASCMQHVSNRLAASHDFVLNAIRVNGRALFDAPIQYQENETLVIASVSQDPTIFVRLAESMRGNLHVQISYIQHLENPVDLPLILQFHSWDRNGFECIASSLGAYHE